MTRPTKAYRVTYRDEGWQDSGQPEASYLTYAHSVEHAELKFFDSDCEGWELVSIERPKDGWGKVTTKFDRSEA